MYEHLMLPLGAFEPKPGGGMRLYGSKGPSVPAPDPRLVEAQIRSMGVQDDMISRVVASAEAMQPLQEEQMRFGLEANRTAFEQSQADRQYALERRGQLTGLQDQMISEARSFDAENRGNELAAQAGADVEQAFANQRQAYGRAMARMGVNPNSGRSAAMDAQMSIAQATAKAGIQGGARQAARAEGRALTDRASNALSGYPAMGMSTTGSGAQFAASGIGLANSAAAGRTAGYGMAGGMAGQMGQNATNMYGTQSRGYYGQQGDSAGSILGGLGGLALGASKFIPPSDRRLKQDIEAVGTHEPTGLTIYEFAYKSDPSRRFRGFMADEVRKVMPDAVVTGDDGFDGVNYSMLGFEMVEV
jgi:hypothetical protein